MPISGRVMGARLHPAGRCRRMTIPTARAHPRKRMMPSLLDLDVLAREQPVRRGVLSERQQGFVLKSVAHDGLGALSAVTRAFTGRRCVSQVPRRRADAAPKTREYLENMRRPRRSRLSVWWPSVPPVSSGDGDAANNAEITGQRLGSPGDHRATTSPDARRAVGPSVSLGLAARRWAPMVSGRRWATL